jgi:hypothetical protein
MANTRILVVDAEPDLLQNRKAQTAREEDEPWL